MALYFWQLPLQLLLLYVRKEPLRLRFLGYCNKANARISLVLFVIHNIILQDESGVLREENCIAYYVCGVLIVSISLQANTV
jgi:hypothetical protein